jgi:glycosyltransferase involved in cell wall biosynthesis
MRFCMITTFFGCHRFGGDAVYVDRLSRALLRHGHEVDIIYSVDAFETVRGSQPLHVYNTPSGLRIHALQGGPGWLAPLWSHQTGRLGMLRGPIQDILNSSDFDVLHFHNISLMGGAGLLSLTDRNKSAVKIMSAHEFWLLCPLSSLWKLDREACERSCCIRCMFAAGRPPQLWRYTSLLARGLDHLDMLLLPSQHTLEKHRIFGERVPLKRLPYFLPEDWAQPAQDYQRTSALLKDQNRPYFAAVGRLVKEKGFQNLIPLMSRMPECDLLIAGTGPFESELRRSTANTPNIHFLGLLDFPELSELYKGARALVVPSLFYETFGYVALEAFSQKIPVIAHNLGALSELITASGGGILFHDEEGLFDAMHRIAKDGNLYRELGAKGYQALRNIWHEDDHLDQYLGIITDLRQGAAQPCLEP